MKKVLTRIENSTLLLWERKADALLKIRKSVEISIHIVIIVIIRRGSRVMSAVTQMFVSSVPVRLIPSAVEPVVIRRRAKQVRKTSNALSNTTINTLGKAR